MAAHEYRHEYVSVQIDWRVDHRTRHPLPVHHQSVVWKLCDIYDVDVATARNDPYKADIRVEQLWRHLLSKRLKREAPEPSLVLVLGHNDPGCYGCPASLATRLANSRARIRQSRGSNFSRAYP